MSKRKRHEEREPASADDAPVLEEVAVEEVAVAVAEEVRGPRNADGTRVLDTPIVPESEEALAEARAIVAELQEATKAHHMVEIEVTKARKANQSPTAECEASRMSLRAAKKAVKHKLNVLRDRASNAVHIAEGEVLRLTEGGQVEQIPVAG